MGFTQAQRICPLDPLETSVMESASLNSFHKKAFEKKNEKEN